MGRLQLFGMREGGRVALRAGLWMGWGGFLSGGGGACRKAGWGGGGGRGCLWQRGEGARHFQTTLGRDYMISVT